jgi:hypothetical protein
MKRNGHVGTELVGKSTLWWNADSLSVTKQAGEAWVLGQLKQQAQDEQVADGVLGGECYDVGVQAA